MLILIVTNCQTFSDSSFYTSDGEKMKLSTFVRVVGPEDGQRRIVDVAKQLGTSVAQQRLSLDDITIDRIDLMMSGSCLDFILFTIRFMLGDFLPLIQRI